MSSLMVSPQRDGVDVRGAARGGVAINAEVRVPAAGRHKVQLTDLSQTGFRMESITFVPNDCMIFLTIPGFAQMEATVAWRAEWIYGCRFSRPLYAAVFDHILRAHPVLCGKLHGFGK